MGGDVGVGELRPTPHTHHNDAARRHWVEFPNPRNTFGEVGVELLEERPPHPRPQVALALPTPGEPRILGLLLTLRGVEKELKIFCVPSTKLRGGWEGPTLSGAGSGLPITPKGGSGRGSVRRGGSLEMKGGAHEAPLYTS